MNIRLVPVNDDNRDAVLALSVREDQPFVAPNDVSLKQADEANAEQAGVARPFAMMTPVRDGYGLCIQRDEHFPDYVGHGGWNEGFLTKWSVSLAEDLCVACMINHSTVSVYEKLSALTDKLVEKTKKA